MSVPRLALLAAIGVAIGANSGALAQCSLQGFGDHRVPPQPIEPPPVSNSYARFSYGSDVLVKNGFVYSWNYIKNDGTEGLAAKWAKVGINQPLGPHPIAPFHAACSWNPIADIADHPNLEHYINRNAPITYSSANMVQPAWAYVEPAAKPSSPSNPVPAKVSIIGRIFSRFATSYLVGQERVRGLDVTVESAIEGRNLEIAVYTNSPTEIIGVGKLSELLGPAGFEQAIDAFKEQGYSVAVASLDHYMAARAAFELLGDDTLATEDRFLFLRGKAKGGVVISVPGTMQLARRSTVLVLLDEDHRSIAADAIRLYGLAAK